MVYKLDIGALLRLGVVGDLLVGGMHNLMMARLMG
jgi:hypothetical protein